MQLRSSIFYILLSWVLVCFSLAAERGAKPAVSDPALPKLKLLDATMCDQVQNYSPLNRSVVFSVSVGKISCFTKFDPVPQKTQIQHRWYYKDTLTTKKKLFLKPPRWSTYSSIQLRDVDKGPWRVEIVDQKNRILGILRFSVTD